MKKKSASQSAFFKLRLLIGILLCFGAVTIVLLAQPRQPGPAAGGQPIISAQYRGVVPIVKFDISPPLRSMVPLPVTQTKNEDEELGPIPVGPVGPVVPDTAVQRVLGKIGIPGPIISFDGPPNLCGGCAPPDPNGAVGPNHVVVMSNLDFQVFHKDGMSVFGPAANNTLWSGFGGGCQTRNDGDPVVLYDQLADRWLLSQFTAVAPYLQCVALSQTNDPTGAYYRWAIPVGNGNNFGDYPKAGMWPDAYYFSTREFAGGSTFVGVGAYALDRAQALAGNPNPTIVSFLAPPNPAYVVGDGLLPGDLDGMTPPPAGSPNYFMGSEDNNGPLGAPQDALTLWKFHYDPMTPANSTFTLTNTLPTQPFNSILALCGGTRACIPQPSTANKIDHLGYRQRPLFRLAYRNFGTHESLVTNQSVSAGTGPNGEVSGVRWYEVRSPNSSPIIFQQGTYAPGLTDGVHRWMGSIAMNSLGDIALGFSASNGSNPSVFPSVFYTARHDGDPLGQMTLGEGSIINGTGSQTGGGNRWGDYTAIDVDPTDDQTFWYINEYIPTTSSAGWRLRIGAFNLGGGASPTPTPTPVGCSWSAGPDMPTPLVRAVGVYFPADGNFYTMGGRTSDTAGSDFQHVLRYTPSTNTWTQMGVTLPDNQMNNMACGVLSLSGTPYIYCVGGSAAGQTTATARVFFYNPATDMVATLTGADNWPGDAAGTILPGGFAVANNKLYILGGFNINVASTNQIWEFDPTAAVGSKWVQRVNTPEGVMYAPTCTRGGFIDLAGASDYQGGTVVDTTNSFSFDPVTNTIGFIPAIPRATGETRGLTFNGKMYVMGGGRVAPNPSNEVDVLDATWTTDLPFTTPRRNFSTDTNGTDKIWLSGGYASDGITPLSSMEIFMCQGGISPTPTATPTATHTPTPTPTGTATATATPIGTPSATPTATCQPNYTTSTSTGTVTAGGTDIGNHCDDCTTLVTLPFPVSVYGNPPISVAYAGSNGTLQFVTVPQPKPFYFMSCIPVDPTQGGPFLNTFFPFYDDQRTDDNPLQACADCGIFTQTLGTAPNRQFVIRWKTTFFNFAGTAEYEVLLTEGSNTLSVIYGDSVNTGATAASGIQQDLNVFTSFSCMEATLTSGLRVNYTPTGCGSPTPTPTATATATHTPTATPTATATATHTPIPTPTPSPGGSPSATPTATATATPTPMRTSPTPRPRPTPPPRP